MRISNTALLLASAALLLGASWLGWEKLQLWQRTEQDLEYQTQIQDLNETNRRQRAQFEEHIADLNRQLRSSAYQLSQLSTQLQETRLAVDPDYEALLQQARDEVARENQGRVAGRVRSAFSRYADPDSALELARENMPRLYDTYINALGIPGTERQQVMNALLDFGARRYQMLSDLLAGALSADQARALFGADALVASMAMALNEEQQRELRLYDQLLKQDTLREVYQEALNRSGGAIDGPVREQVVQALVNELVSAENNWGALVAEDGSMLTAYNDRVAAFDRARESLATELEPEQLNQLDRFIEAQNDGVDVILEASTDGSGRVSIRQARIGVEDLPQ